jgi:nucleoside-diphosphate-sugar epimerase
MDIAEMVRDVVGSSVGLAVEKTDDLRSYHISSARIEHEIGFRPKHTIPIAIENLAEAFTDGRVPDAMTDPRYYNIKTMQEAGLR